VAVRLIVNGGHDSGDIGLVDRFANVKQFVKVKDAVFPRVLGAVPH
jgi:hypothetical protein